MGCADVRRDDRFQVWARRATAREALAVARSVDPDVVLMDLRMPEMDGVSAIRALAEQGSRARVLVLTTYDTDSDVLPAIRPARPVILLKDTPREELFRAVSGGVPGRVGASPRGGRTAHGLGALARRRTAQPARARGADADRARCAPTARRRGGCSISEATVKTHLLHAYAKLGVRDRAAAVAAAFERGIARRRLTGCLL
jgi:DNA-binding NarL/FixJ family response regulator